jgi:ABC-type glycerol-3-phosphate transport system permease component
MKTSVGDKVISVVTYLVYSLFAFVCVYPFYYIFINTLSANNLSERSKVVFWIKGFHLSNYVSVLKIPDLFQSMRISVARTVIGTLLTVIIAAFLGYMFTREACGSVNLVSICCCDDVLNAGIIPGILQ